MRVIQSTALRLLAVTGWSADLSAEAIIDGRASRCAKWRGAR